MEWLQNPRLPSLSDFFRLRSNDASYSLWMDKESALDHKLYIIARHGTEFARDRLPLTMTVKPEHEKSYEGFLKEFTLSNLSREYSDLEFLQNHFIRHDSVLSKENEELVSKIIFNAFQDYFSFFKDDDGRERNIGLTGLVRYEKAKPIFADINKYCFSE